MPSFSKPSDDVVERDYPFPDLKEVGDPALRLAARLIQEKDFRQLEQRTGIPDPEGKFKETKRRLSLPVLVRFDKKKRRIVEPLEKRFGIPLAYRAAISRNRKLTHVTARIPLEEDIFSGSVDSLVKAVQELRAHGATHVSLGAPGQPSLKRADSSLAEIGLLPDRSYKGKPLTGQGVIVGIIDDGCALAHNNFLKPRASGVAAQSRILYLWDQGGRGNTAAGWTAPPDFGGVEFGGLELDQAAIDAALKLPAHRNGDLIREDLVYEYLGYPIGQVATHGTHVMDIAAGNGQSVMGIEGVAPEADIIFVQLPSESIEGGATALWQNVVDGVLYISERAKALNKPAVINISYGGYDGPHDGTSELEVTIDELLADPDLAVVLAAGNGFEERCHARRKVTQAQPESLYWILRPQDPTGNDLELWYDDDATYKLRVRLRSPGPVIDPSGWIEVGQASIPITTPSDGNTIGSIEHLRSETGNGANRIWISLNATDGEALAPAPSGTWLIELELHAVGQPAPQPRPEVEVHAWIWRDDAGRPRDARRRQSRFHPDHADPASTIAGWATGKLAISTGAYNSATREVCRYSACGPTRPGGGKSGRPKPEVYAPAEEDVRGRGILSASARSTKPTRMNGTSAAAPHITGMIALMFEYAQKHAVGGPKSLTADQIGKELKAATAKGKLKLNRHQKVDARVKKKQEGVKQHLLSSGKADFGKTMNKLKP